MSSEKLLREQDVGCMVREVKKQIQELAGNYGLAGVELRASMVVVAQSNLCRLSFKRKNLAPGIVVNESLLNCHT
jgi:hypothetical protein